MQFQVFNYVCNLIYGKILDRNWFSTAYLSRDRRSMTWVSNYRYSIFRRKNVGNSLRAGPRWSTSRHWSPSACGVAASVKSRGETASDTFSVSFHQTPSHRIALFFAAHACVSKVSPFTEYDRGCKFYPKTGTSGGSKGRAYKSQTEVKPAGQAKQNAPLPPPPLLRPKLGSSTGCEPNTVRQGLGQPFCFGNI